MNEIEEISLENILDGHKSKISIIKKHKDKKNMKIDHIDISTFINDIMNKGLVKFDHKNQVSMFYIACKVLNIFTIDLASQNISVPKNIFDNYITQFIPKIIKEFTGNLKKRCKKNINPDAICMGRKLDNRQCTRKKHAGFDFCKSHLQKLSNGRIDQTHTAKINIKSKRGRKRKVEFDPRQYDNEYITLWEDIIDGQKVFIDNNNNVYTFDLDNPTYLGKKKIDFNLDLTKIIEKTPIKTPTNTDFKNNINSIKEPLISKNINEKKKVTIQRKKKIFTIDNFLE